MGNTRSKEKDFPCNATQPAGTAVSQKLKRAMAETVKALIITLKNNSVCSNETSEFPVIASRSDVIPVTQVVQRLRAAQPMTSRLFDHRCDSDRLDSGW